MSAVMAVGAGMAAYGMLRKGRVAKAFAEYNANVLEERAREEGINYEITAEKIRRAKKQALGKQKAAFLKAGVKLEGTPLEVLADTAVQYEKDVAIADYNKRVNQARMKAGAEAQRIAGKEAWTAAVWGAGSTVLTAAGSGGGGEAPMSYYGSWS